jgi:malate dehydrogenase (quinone)
VDEKEVDVVLIGAGAMSATLGSILNQFDPSLSITVVERLDKPLQESSDGWNNAGTGHAAYCELNYTPQRKDGSVDVHKAYGINARYEVSLQYWSYLVKQGVLPEPHNFINPVPHISFVWGEDNVTFLRKRHNALIDHPMFAEMEFSDNPEVLREWMPLVMKGRDPQQKVAATRVAHGTDVDFGAVSRYMLNYLETQENFNLLLHSSVENLTQEPDKRWSIQLKDQGDKNLQLHNIKAKFVFIGAGGAALPLLQKSGIKNGKGYGGFPVSGQFLVCKNPLIVKQHLAKVYGKASVGAPPMSVPHLDSRFIDGETALLFGPFAGFTTKFLKQGSVLDLLKSLRFNNILPVSTVGIKNLSLLGYLLKESFKTADARLKALRKYYPEAEDSDWSLHIAGQRVQIIKRDVETGGGKLQFGTEVVYADDKSLAALLGASPGASLLVPIVLEIIETCFSDHLKTAVWQQNIRSMIPSYGISIVSNQTLFMSIREDTLKTLKLRENT